MIRYADDRDSLMDLGLAEVDTYRCADCFVTLGFDSDVGISGYVFAVGDGDDRQVYCEDCIDDHATADEIRAAVTR